MYVCLYMQNHLMHTCVKSFQVKCLFFKSFKIFLNTLNFQELIRTTSFSKQEIQCMYRGFKQVSSNKSNLCSLTLFDGAVRYMYIKVAFRTQQRNVSSKNILVNQNKWGSRKGIFSKKCFLVS